MTNKKNLTAGNFYFVSGNVSYSQITRQCTDEEREASNNRTGLKRNANFYSLTISDATVRYADENNPTPEEQYAKSSFYTNKDGEICYQEERFSNYKPDVFIKNDDTGMYDKVELDHEIPRGVPVIVAYQVYDNSYGPEVTFQKVFVEEDYRKRFKNSFSSQLRNLGITINPESYRKEG